MEEQTSGAAKGMAKNGDRSPPPAPPAGFIAKNENGDPAASPFFGKSRLFDFTTPDPQSLLKKSALTINYALSRSLGGGWK